MIYNNARYPLSLLSFQSEIARKRERDLNSSFYCLSYLRLYTRYSSFRDARRDVSRITNRAKIDGRRGEYLSAARLPRFLDLSCHLQIAEGIKRLKRDPKLRVGVSERRQMRAAVIGDASVARKEREFLDSMRARTCRTVLGGLKSSEKDSGASVP